MMSSTTVACGAGFAGDRLEPAIEFAQSGEVATVVLECLAERTLVAGLLDRAADSNAGFDRRLERRLASLLPLAHAAGCRIVSNLGSANPLAAGQAVARMGRSLGLRGLRIAVVLGDDISRHADKVRWADELGGTPEEEWLGVHAYLGMSAIATALAEGADIVLTGRSSDSALFAAPAAAFLDLDDAGVAGATTIGHLLECGGQLTGGNLAAWQGPKLGPADYADLGYPMAEVFADGSAEISVLPGKPARLDVLTVTLQLLYEVHDPRAYLTPDVTLDFAELDIEQRGTNRVRVSGVVGLPRPQSLKAVGFLRHPGMVADLEIAYAGEGALDRAQRAGDTLRVRMGRLGVTDFNIDYVGVDSVLGAATHPAAVPPAEARMHVSARCPSREVAQAAEDELYTLTLAGPPGGCCMRSEQRPNVEVVSGLIAREYAQPRIEWCTA